MNEIDQLILFITPFLPHLAKVGAGAADEVGKSVVGGSLHIAKRMWTVFAERWSKRSNGQAPSPDPVTFAKDLRELIATDPVVAKQLLALLKQAGEPQVPDSVRSLSAGDISSSNVIVGDSNTVDGQKR